MARTPVRNETSAGVIVFFDDPRAGRLWLTLRHAARHWDYPKGHVEPGETVLQAALRELEEEAALTAEQVRLVDGFDQTIDYWFTGRDGVRIHKTVHYFLGWSSTRQVTISQESEDYAWLGESDCLKRLTYKTARDLLRSAANFLDAASGR